VLIAAFVLMKQNRISVIVDRRDHLDLQINLRTERQATQIIQMLDRLSAMSASSMTMTPTAANSDGLSPSATWSMNCTAACRTRRAAEVRASG